MTTYTCDYDLVELVLGENWTEGRKKKREYICRQCASKIAMGKMSRSDRVKDTKSGKTKVQPDLLEGVKPRVRAMLTPEILESLARPFDEIVKTIRIRSFGQE